MKSIPPRLRTFWRSRIDPFAVVSETDIPFSESEVNAEIERWGIRLVPLTLDVEAFSRWAARFGGCYPDTYRVGYGPYFQEKCLEHYLSLQFCPITDDTVIIDVANAGSPFPAIARKLGATVYENDLVFPSGTSRIGEKHYRIGGNACCLPLPETCADLMVLHCAFEMFQGNQDVLLIREAGRILKPGGLLILIPLYLSSQHHILCDIGASRSGCDYDAGATVVYLPRFNGIKFARFYDAKAFALRVASAAEAFDLSVGNLVNAAALNPEREHLYLRYIGMLQKR